jgi:hypothetical protein
LEYILKEDEMSKVYRINLTLEFDDVSVRDRWYDKIKVEIASEKISSGATKTAVIVKDDYDIPDRIVENL